MTNYKKLCDALKRTYVATGYCSDCKGYESCRELEKNGDEFYCLFALSEYAIEELQTENETICNELCLRCGSYREAHNGACNGCRWRADNGVD